jgi:RNA polymerase sigma-70 factor (ECF subfamily)
LIERSTYTDGIAQGDRQAFLSLYEDFFVALCVFSRQFVHEREQAEDIVQDVFCRIYDTRPHLSGVESLKAYLYGAVRNACLNHLREDKRRREREGRFVDELRNDAIFFDMVIENEVYRQLHFLLNELPPKCRAVFEKTIDGATSEEIAHEMNISVETVKTQRKKAKRLLREKYALLYKVFGRLF